ncbi:MAG: transporter substrate-binding domain-containing protein [Rhodospirillaceae bacterium]|nr:transporter substrate-binding domain-containing protein [Rhodospirillaceae bacterium]
MIRDTRTDEPWRIGVLFSRTGVTAVIEESQLKGTLLAIEEINAAGGVNRREVVPIIYDPGSDPRGFVRYSHKLLTEDRVTTIFGCYTSSSRKAVLPLVERRNGLLWYPTLYEGFEYSPNVIYTGATPNQNSLVLVDYMIEHYGDRFFFIGSDYVYARESNRVMRDLLEERGGEVVAEQYYDLRAAPQEFRHAVREIRRKRPDVIFSTVVGQSTVYLYEAYCDAGLNAADMPICSLTTSEAEVRQMGAGVACGHITAAPYFQSVSGSGNAAFVDRYKRRFGADEPTNMCAEAAYFQVHVFARALARCNSMDTDVLRPVVLGSDFEAPQGRICIARENNHTELWTRIGRLNAAGQFDIVHESTLAVRPDPYLVSHGILEYAV